MTRKTAKVTTRTLRFEQFESRDLLAANIFQINSAVIQQLYSQGQLAQQDIRSEAAQIRQKFNQLLNITLDAGRDNATEVADAARSGNRSELRAEVNDAKAISRDVAALARAQADLSRQLASTTGDINRIAANIVRDYIRGRQLEEEALAAAESKLEAAKQKFETKTDAIEQRAESAASDAQSRVDSGAGSTNADLNKLAYKGLTTVSTRPVKIDGTQCPDEIGVQLGIGVTPTIDANGIVSGKAAVLGTVIVDEDCVTPIQTLNSILDSGRITGFAQRPIDATPQNIRGRIEYTLPRTVVRGVVFPEATVFFDYQGTISTTEFKASILVNNVIKGNFTLTPDPVTLP